MSLSPRSSACETPTSTRSLVLLRPMHSRSKRLLPINPSPSGSAHSPNLSSLSDSNLNASKGR